MHIPTINPILKNTSNNLQNLDTKMSNNLKQNCLHLKVPTNFIKIIIFLVLINAKVLNALKCVCNVNDCDIIKADQCPGRGVLVWDPCRWAKYYFLFKVASQVPHDMDWLFNSHHPIHSNFLGRKFFLFKIFWEYFIWKSSRGCLDR